MQKVLSLVLLTAAFLPGCKQKKESKKTKDDPKSVNIPMASNGAKKGFFDEEVDGFVLEDDKVAQNDKKDESLLAQTDTKQFQAIYFDFDKYSIRQDQQDPVDRDAKEALKLVQDEQKTVVVEGHADHAAGSKTYNLILSEHRAQEVAKQLEQAGVPAERVKVVGRGTEMPVVLGGNRQEQAPNRRVEMFQLQA